MNENQVPNNMNQNNINGVNTTVSSVPPIAEVKVEIESLDDLDIVDDTEVKPTEISNVSEGANNKSFSEPPKNSKVSTVLLILLFVFLFAFVMGMPYIHEFMQRLKDDAGLSEIEKEAKEEEERQQQEEESNRPVATPDDEKTKELICISGSNVVGNYTLVETQKFYYNSKNKVLSSKVISEYTFTSVDADYNALKQQCDEDSLKYLTHSGYTMACSYGESNIEISHEFDLETFTPIIDGNTNIQANATYQQDLNTIKTNLISQGYTCQ